MSEEIAKSPCIDICQLDEAGICIGCYRSLEEIGRWTYLDNTERLDIIAKASTRKNGAAHD